MVALDTKLPCQDCLIHIGREGRLAGNAPFAYVGVGADEVEVAFGPLFHVESARCHELVLFIGACYAAAVATKLVIPAIPSPARPIRVSADQLLGPDAFLLDRPVEIGEVHLAGAGAVGNAFLYALSMVDVRGILHVSDPDVVSDGNLNRCLFFRIEHVARKKAEVLVAEAQTRFNRLQLLPHDVRLEALPKRKDGRNFDRVVVGVDSRRARRGLQHEFPREVYDASTTGIEEVVLHFNQLPTPLACLACVYHQEETENVRERHIADTLGVTVDDVRQNWILPEAADRICARYPSIHRARVEGEAYDSLFKALCGQAELKTAKAETVLAPFAFVSALAGGLLALEFVRRVSRSDPVSPFNYWRASPWAPPVPRMRQMLARREGCEFCENTVFKRISHELWGSG